MKTVQVFKGASSRTLIDITVLAIIFALFALCFHVINIVNSTTCMLLVIALVFSTSTVVTTVVSNFFWFVGNPLRNYAWAALALFMVVVTHLLAYMHIAIWYDSFDILTDKVQLYIIPIGIILSWLCAVVGIIVGLIKSKYKANDCIARLLVVPHRANVVDGYISLHNGYKAHYAYNHFLGVSN